MPRFVELMLMALGAWTALIIGLACLVSVAHLVQEHHRRRAERQDALDLLIQECRCPSRWIVPELRGRG